MTPEPNGASSRATPDGVVEDAPMATREAADSRSDDTSVPAATTAKRIHRIEGEAGPPGAPRVSLRRGRPSEPAKSRRLGPFEYTLLALIALGIAITLVMAILNPS